MLQSTQEGRKRSKQPAVLHGSAQGPGEWTVSTRRPCGGCKQPSTGDLTTWIFAEQNWNRKGGCFNLGDAKMAIWKKRIVINHGMMVWILLRFHTSPRRSGGFLQDFKHLMVMIISSNFWFSCRGPVCFRWHLILSWWSSCESHQKGVLIFSRTKHAGNSETGYLVIFLMIFWKQSRGIFDNLVSTELRILGNRRQTCRDFLSFARAFECDVGMCFYIFFFQIIDRKSWYTKCIQMLAASFPTWRLPKNWAYPQSSSKSWDHSTWFEGPKRLGDLEIQSWSPIKCRENHALIIWGFP